MLQTCYGINNKYVPFVYRTKQSARLPNLHSLTQLLFFIPTKANMKLTTQQYHVSSCFPPKRWNLRPNCTVSLFFKTVVEMFPKYTVSVRLQRSKCLSLPSAVDWYNYTSIVFTEGHKERNVRVFAVSQGGHFSITCGPRAVEVRF